MKIRRALLHDKEQLQHLFRTVIDDTFRLNNLSDEEDKAAEYQTKIHYLQSDFDTEGQEKKFFVAELDERIIGCITYGKANQMINEITHDALKETFEIGTLYVHPDYQGNRIGSRLIDHVREDMKQNGITHYCLDCGYKTAQVKWCRKFGEPTYNAQDYWGKNDDHLIWVRVIDETYLK
ncbi:GNAT family N-acetyltransferase [Macrococcus lamae]|nr:GNAT family N-acetyltransferase [Macrococcus lamae]